MRERTLTPHLFGLNNSNRDFSQKDTWGKNQFNSSFPAALCCYMEKQGHTANYLCVKNNELVVREIGFEEAFGIELSNPDAYFAFEVPHSPFQKYIIGKMPRTDLVMQNLKTGQCLTGLEIKLTALPDNVTCFLEEPCYGSEIVIRPDSIAYLACSIAGIFGENLREVGDFVSVAKNLDWSDPEAVISIYPIIDRALENICIHADMQRSFLLQPVWKTEGKSSRLAENCLDVFIWSDIAFAFFIRCIAELDVKSPNKITRPARTAIWLYKMLDEIARNGKFNHENIIDDCSYNTKNDKAFASSGHVTNKFMKSERLACPIIRKGEIRNIILGGGQELLSPERRFDAIIYNSPELFS